MNEFELISHYFLSHARQRDDVVTGIGDDAAILTPPAGKQLVTTVDTLIAGVHFPEQTAAYDIAYKALAVNLSDLAAMAAEPAWMTLAITLPEYDALWLDEFTKGLCVLANQYNIALVGGDTTRGHLSVTIQLSGFVDVGKAVLRNGARVDDLLCVTGTIGDAWLGLQEVQHTTHLSEVDREHVLTRLSQPTPRIEIGRALAGFASSMIDVSDGLLADLGHILELSQVGAELVLKEIPLSSAASHYLSRGGDIMRLLSGGDDYELCFTLPASNATMLSSLAEQTACAINCIGKIIQEEGIVVLADEKRQRITANGYQHFT